MNQSKTVSVIEQVTNTTIGYVLAVITQMILFPFFGIYVEHHENFVIAAVFTVVSLIRGYWVRRMFNHLHPRLEGAVALLYRRQE